MIHVRMCVPQTQDLINTRKLAFWDFSYNIVSDNQPQKEYLHLNVTVHVPVLQQLWQDL